MRGSIYRKTKPDGSWSRWYCVTDLPPGPTGKRRQKTTTHNTRKEAENALAERIRAINTGNYYDSNVMLKEYLADWLESKRSIRTSTRRSYEMHIRVHINPRLGHVRLVSLRPRHVESLVRELSESSRLSVASARRIHATLRAALNHAARTNLIASNPAQFVELPAEQRGRMTVWGAEQVHGFLSENSGDRLIALYYLLALRGLRRGEAVGLRWTDVDLDGGFLTIQQQLMESGRAISFGPPKTASGARTVSLDEGTINALRAHRARQNAERLACGELWQDSGLVFTTEDGSPLRPSVASSHFQRLVKASELPRIRLHDLRHSSASLGLEAGESLKEVSARLGHSTITITADTYAHISPELARESAERLARLVAGYSTLDER